MNLCLRNAMLLILLLCVTAMAVAQGTKSPPQDIDNEALSIISNNEVSAMLLAGPEPVRVSGRMSVSLNASGTDLEEGIVKVANWNLAMFSVPQAEISGGVETGPKEGLLAFASAGEASKLRYDATNHTLHGKIEGYVDTSQLSRITLPTTPSKRGEVDFFPTATQPATLEIEVQMAAALDPGFEVQQNRAIVNGALHVHEYEVQGRRFPAYELSIHEAVLKLDISRLLLFEVAKQLCIQPVRIGRFNRFLDRFTWFTIWPLTTGTGLAFGQPGVTTEWNKADVVYQYRDWMTVWDNSYWVTSETGTEEDDLLDEVDVDDCIEVFFVHDFDPEDAHGGGFARGCGTATSKVISSDANQRYGVDFTHLAHEFGHVIGLHHPWASLPGCPSASTGTLMCGSGFRNDNPTVNSQENKDLLSNPLLTFAFKRRTVGPDCQDDADCGACP